jgi:hypothetical protein
MEMRDNLYSYIGGIMKNKKAKPEQEKVVGYIRNQEDHHRKRLSKRDSLDCLRNMELNTTSATFGPENHTA